MSAERDWWRGNDIDTRNRLAQAMEQGNGEELVFDQIYIGQAALRLISNMASAKDVALIMAGMVVSCENEVRECTKALLLLEDPGSTKGRELHFQARVAAAIISHLNQLVQDGMTAAQTINLKGQPS